jgi:hypothetical protein
LINSLSLSIDKKIRDMAKKSTNSGFERQAAVMSQMTRDAKAAVSKSSATAVAMRGAEARAEYRAKVEKPVRVSFKFLATGK